MEFREVYKFYFKKYLSCTWEISWNWRYFKTWWSKWQEIAISEEVV